MIHGTTINPFEVITIRFPFSDLSAAKQRPVVAITAPDNNGDFVCLAVTSKPGHADSVTIEQADLVSGSLPITSFVRSDKIYTLHTSILQNHVGKLSESKVIEIKTAYCRKIGCEKN